MNTESRRITRRTALAGMAGATVVVGAFPAVANGQAPAERALTPDEREVLELYRRTAACDRDVFRRVSKVISEFDTGGAS